MPVAAAVHRVMHVAEGTSCDADLPLGVQRTWVIGTSADLCDVVLSNEGVVRRHCVLATDARGHVSCTALEAAVWIGQRRLAPGASVAMPDFLPLRCGEATLLVGPEGSDWRYSVIAAARAPRPGQRGLLALRRVRRASPNAFAAMVMGSLLLLAGSVWGAASWLAATPSLPLDDSARADRWLRSVAPEGSELKLIADEAHQRWVVSGFVGDARDRDMLEAVASRLREAPRVEVMFGEAAAAARSRAPTVKAPVPRAAAAAVSSKARLASGPTKGDRKYSVLMSNKRGSTLIGPTGRRWAEGDRFRDMTIRRIALDYVEFERDREPVVLWLAQID
jgi:hypothetical protein